MAFDLFRKHKRTPAESRQIRSRTELLNHLVATHGYQRYLEIGVRNPKDNFDRVRATEKESVDPDPLVKGPRHAQMTSDEYFGRLAVDAPDRRFDLVFVDGLHLADQVERDVVNSLAHVEDGGAIVLHDCNPLTEQAQSETYVKKQHWNGTVWQAWAKLRGTRPDLSMCVIDIDEGCGVIRRGSQTCYSPWPPGPLPLPYSYLVANRTSLLNLVSVSEFLQQGG